MKKILILLIVSCMLVITVNAVSAAEKKSSRASLMEPTGTVSNPYSYYPGTEKLGPDEARVIALGSGLLPG